jgi:hypothetical protein
VVLDEVARIPRNPCSLRSPALSIPIRVFKKLRVQKPGFKRSGCFTRPAYNLKGRWYIHQHSKQVCFVIYPIRVLHAGIAHTKNKNILLLDAIKKCSIKCWHCQRFNERANMQELGYGIPVHSTVAVSCHFHQSILMTLQVTYFSPGFQVALEKRRS